MTGADQRFADALTAEYAAIFGYGVVGAHLPEHLLSLARDAESAHRERRDAALLRLSAGRVALPAPAVDYALPFPVTGTASALRLAVLLEERTAAIWRQALPDTTGPTRRVALDALTDYAVRAARWRRAAGDPTGVVTFPGAPG